MHVSRNGKHGHAPLGPGVGDSATDEQREAREQQAKEGEEGLVAAAVQQALADGEVQAGEHLLHGGVRGSTGTTPITAGVAAAVAAAVVVAAVVVVACNVNTTLGVESDQQVPNGLQEAVLACW